MSRIVAVTGATGFVGKELCSQLDASGVLTLRFRSGDNSNRDTSSSDAKPLDLLASESSWAQVLAGVDTVVHLAALTHESSRVEGATGLFHSVNVAGTENLVRASAKAGVKRFVFMSSIKVNGESTQSERGFSSRDIPAPTTAYGMTKLEAEDRVVEICEANSMDWVVVRTPLVCGGGVKGNLNQLIGWASRHLPMPFGAINNRRSMISVVDLGLLLKKCVFHDGPLQNVLLAADDQTVSTAILCRWIINELNSRSLLLPLPSSVLALLLRLARRDEMVDKLISSLVVDNSEAKQCLGWAPKDGVEMAVRRMVSQYVREAGEQ